jgi:hypothetical protein
MEPRTNSPYLDRKPKTQWYRIVLIILIPAAFALGYFLSYTPPDPSPELRKLESAEANQLYRNFIKRGITYCDTLKSMKLSFEQYAAMRRIMENEEVKGIHIYYGYDGDQMLKILVGCDANGKDIVSNIFAVNVASIELCPTICDGPSPITELGE